MKLLPVILSGGSDTRRWPVSREALPKPIIRVAAAEQVSSEFRLQASLDPGLHAFTVALPEMDRHLKANFEWQDNFLVFEVGSTDKPTFIGTNWLDGRFVASRDKRVPVAILQ